jgi:hypothetical protein
MAERGLGNEAQTRAVAEQVARAAYGVWSTEHPPKSDMPAPLKWAAAIISAVMAAGAVAMCIWVVSTLSDLQQTVTRIDERQKLVGDSGDRRFTEIERRVVALEASNQAGKDKR